MVKTRFAPSPTGWLHIGGARTALFSWLYARHFGGEFILRIEDTDLQRSKKEYEEEILRSMEWLGLNWDGLEYQSKRFDIYREAAQKLVKEGKAYEKDGAIFMPLDFQQVVIDDLVRGEIVFNELPKEEEVLIKSDGSPTYSFACAVDDSMMKITHVVRGQDHIPNTPKQILMCQALGYTPPKYAHLPMILAQEGGKMSKRHGATAITEYREDGYLNKAIVNYLLLLGWSPKENQEIIELEEAVKQFDLKDINKSNAKFDLVKLNWLNAEYIKKADESFLAQEAEKEIIKKGNVLKNKADAQKIVSMFKERVEVLTDFADQSEFLFQDNPEMSEEVQKVLNEPMTPEITALKEALANTEPFTKDEIEKTFHMVGEKLGIKHTKMFLPSRTAISGKKSGPGLFDIIEFLGKEKALARYEKLLEIWKNKS